MIYTHNKPIKRRLCKLPRYELFYSPLTNNCISVVRIWIACIITFLLLGGTSILVSPNNIRFRESSSLGPLERKINKFEYVVIPVKWILYSRSPSPRFRGWVVKALAFWTSGRGSTFQKKIQNGRTTIGNSDLRHASIILSTPMGYYNYPWLGFSKVFAIAFSDVS